MHSLVERPTEKVYQLGWYNPAGPEMAGKRDEPEDVVRRQGLTVAHAVRKVGVTVKAYGPHFIQKRDRLQP